MTYRRAIYEYITQRRGIIGLYIGGYLINSFEELSVITPWKRIRSFGDKSGEWK